MTITAFVFALWLNAVCGDRNREDFFVNGTLANITEYSHSVYLHVSVSKYEWSCGSSILNQLILLTAAHCVNEVKIDGGAIKAYHGNNIHRLGRAESVQQFVVHTNYKDTDASNDIAVLRTSMPLPLGNNLGRVAIFEAKYTPYYEIGVVAGWGLVDEVDKLLPSRLDQVSQAIKIHSKCENIVTRNLPPGFICGGKRKVSSYVTQGDSGSALIVKGYIQVGIVSYKYISVDTAISTWGIFMDGSRKMLKWNTVNT